MEKKNVLKFFGRSRALESPKGPFRTSFQCNIVQVPGSLVPKCAGTDVLPSLLNLPIYCHFILWGEFQLKAQCCEQMLMCGFEYG